MASKAVAERSAPKVPDLVPTPALQITAEDVALPRIYIGQFMSAAVQSQLVKAGTIFAGTGGDDPDPQVLWSPGDPEGVLFHVIGLRKAKSFAVDGELMLYDYDDPSAPEDAWVTYNYTVFLPDFDTEVPYKLLLTRTGRPTALKINTVLKKNEIGGPAWASAFRLTATERSNPKGKFFVAQVKTNITADQGHVAKAAELALQIAGAYSSGATFRSGEEPSI
jgi:hypothetical protein